MGKVTRTGDAPLASRLAGSSERARNRGLARLLLIVSLISFLAAAASWHQYRRDTLGLVSGLPDPALDPRPPLFGVNADLDQYADPGPALDRIGDLGATWVRQTFPWEAIEPAPGEYDWARWDGIVEGAAARGLRMIAVLRHTPGWANGGRGPNVPPDDFRNFGGFASAFAERYGDRIDVYQIWDEPNLSSAWGGPPSAPGYAALLQAAYAGIHAADPASTVLLAGLAPTVETGPDNLSDLLFLGQLYEAGAGDYFDAAAGKPYGYDTSPLERDADPLQLKFSRFVLLRQVMEAQGEHRKLLWGTNFGWNALPAGWTGQASIWGQVSEDEQGRHTREAYRRALVEWPWSGPLILDGFDPKVPGDDPRLGFSMFDASGEPRPSALGFTAEAREYEGLALPGTHGADEQAARYTGDWEFSELGADIPEKYEGARVEFSFYGTDVALRIRRGDYRGHLYVTVDGEPAGELPLDSRGSYLVLTSPELKQEVVTVPVAIGLPEGQHTLEVVPERGWDQWAIAGFAVGRHYPGEALRWIYPALIALGIVASAVALRIARGRWEGIPLQRLREGLGKANSVGAAVLAAVLYLSAWLTWGESLTAITRRFDNTLPLLATAATAGLLYFSPWFLITLLSAVALLITFWARLDLAFPLIALAIPFYLIPRPLFDKAFSMVELLTLLAFAAWALRQAGTLRKRLTGTAFGGWPARVRAATARLTLVDWAAAALLIVSALSLLQAEVRGVAIREFRVAILEPAILYLMLRTTPLNRPQLWRVMDFFILGAALVAAIGLYQYATGTNLITAEGGVERIRSVFGSPNNVGLYLGRAAGPLAAVALMARSSRRWAYLAAGLVVAPALVLTYSKGALLLGLPAALAVVLVAWRGRQAAWALAGAAAAFGAALVPLSRNPRFAGILDLGAGTSFFRIKVWQSALRMIADHPWLGVGPDNFLYAYRGRYILPEAWQEPNLSHPHNVVLDFAARLGLLGLAAAVALQIGFWQTAVRAFRRLKDDPDLRALTVGFMASMANFLAHGIVDVAYFIVDLSFVLFLTLGLAWQLAERPVDN